VTGRQVGNRAVVIGGGLAGLLAARALAGAFGQVLVLDRRPLAAGRPRTRPAQLLHGRAEQVLRELFPGLIEELLEAGALSAEFGAVRQYLAGRPLLPAADRTLAVDPTDLEARLLVRVQALPAVRFAAASYVLGLVGDPTGDRVRGVRVRTPHGRRDEVVEADLVVDAAGRSSATPGWLAGLGYRAPGEDRIPVGDNHISQQYLVRDEAVFAGALALEVAAEPADRRGALLVRLGGGRCVLTVRAPGDLPAGPAELVDWTRTLPTPDLHSALAGASPLGDPAPGRFEFGARRRYDLLDRLPDRLLVLGDALASVNPAHRLAPAIVGQQALVLREQVRYGLPQPLVFAKEVAGALDVPWNLAAGADLRLAGMPGACGADVEVDAAFLARVRAAATRDPVLAGALVRVTGLLDPPETLLTTDIVARALGSRDVAHMT